MIRLSRTSWRRVIPAVPALLWGSLLLAAAGCSAARPTALPGIARDAAALEQASLEAFLAGNMSEALLLEEEALRSWRRIDAASHVSAALNRVGGLQLQLGDPVAAQRDFREARALAVEVADLQAEAAALNNLGRVAAARGEAESARGFFRKARERASDADADDVEASATANLASLSYAAGDLAQARRLLDEASSSARSAGDAGLETRLLRNLAVLDIAEGRPDEALPRLETAHQQDREREDVLAIARDLELMSDARFAMDGASRRAIGERRRAWEILRQFPDSRQAEDCRLVIERWCGSWQGGETPVDCEFPTAADVSPMVEEG